MMINMLFNEFESRIESSNNSVWGFLKKISYLVWKVAVFNSVPLGNHKVVSPTPEYSLVMSHYKIIINIIIIILIYQFF